MRDSLFFIFTYSRRLWSHFTFQNFRVILLSLRYAGAANLRSILYLPILVSKLSSLLFSLISACFVNVANRILLIALCYPIVADVTIKRRIYFSLVNYTSNGTITLLLVYFEMILRTTVSFIVVVCYTATYHSTPMHYYFCLM